MISSCYVERCSGEYKHKTVRRNSYFNKANPPACMMTDEMHLEINDSVFNNFVSRNFSYTLWNMNGLGLICF